MIISSCQACNTVITIREQSTPIPIITNYSETTLENVQHFLNHMELCPWAGADNINTCSLNARYFSITSKKVGLNIDEVTIRDWDQQRIKRTICSGHRVNVFEFNGTKYYTTNLYYGDTRIVNRLELQNILTDLNAEKN